MTRKHAGSPLHGILVTYVHWHQATPKTPGLDTLVALQHDGLAWVYVEVYRV